MKFLFCLLILLLFFNCNQEQGTPTDTISKTVKNSYLDKNTKEIYFDSFAYEFIRKIEPFGSNDILIESLLDFEEIFINFTPRKKFSKNENVLSLMDMNIGLGPIATYDKKDSLFVQQQIKDSKDSNWSIYQLQRYQTLNDYYQWKDENPFFKWEAFKSAGFGCFVTLSAPVFNLLKNKAVLVIGHQCHGTLGSGNVYLFQLEKNGTWKMVNNRQLWIS